MNLWRLGILLTAVVGSSALVGCSSGADDPYTPTPAWSGRKPTLPNPPTLSTTPIKAGDVYSVYGAGHQLRSRIHNADVTKNSITIQGYIVQENISDAPKCAIHKTGKADPADCPPAGQTIEIPSFWIADNKGDDATKPRIRVLGWAHNWAAVYEAMDKYKNMKEVKDPAKDLYQDEQWSTAVPFPLPAVGAKVKVTGKYGFTFTKASNGIVSDPINGVMTYEKIEYVEPAPTPVTFKNK